MAHLGIRDLQRISGEAISQLPGPVAIRSGDRLVGFIFPVRRGDPRLLQEAADEALRHQAMRHPAEDDSIFVANPDLDPHDYTRAEIDAVLKPRR